MVGATIRTWKRPGENSYLAEALQGDKPVQAVANAIPVVRVRDDRAYVTHEAAIGTVNKKELETLMARGLTEEEAVDVIIRGMLQ